MEYPGTDLESMSYAQNYHKWILKSIAKCVTGNIAEIGAGSGNFSKELLSLNPQKLYSFEPSLNMFPKLDKTLEKFSNAKASDSYFSVEENLKLNLDTILYINVLEHIENDLEELKFSLKALNTQGHLIIFVPALQFLFSDYDKHVGHFRRYHKEDLKTLVQEAGFNIKSIKYFDIAGVLPWYISNTLLKRSLNPKDVALYDKLVVPIMNKIEPILPLPFGKNLLLIAQKI